MKLRAIFTFLTLVFSFSCSETEFINETFMIKPSGAAVTNLEDKKLLAVGSSRIKALQFFVFRESASGNFESEALLDQGNPLFPKRLYFSNVPDRVFNWKDSHFAVFSTADNKLRLINIEILKKILFGSEKYEYSELVKEVNLNCRGQESGRVLKAGSYDSGNKLWFIHSECQNQISVLTDFNEEKLEFSSKKFCFSEKPESFDFLLSKNKLFASFANSSSGNATLAEYDLTELESSCDSIVNPKRSIDLNSHAKIMVSTLVEDKSYLYFQEYDSAFPKAGLWPDKLKEISFLHSSENNPGSTVCGEKDYVKETSSISNFGTLTSIITQEYDNKTLTNFTGIQSCNYNSLIWLGFSSGAIIPFDPVYNETLTDFSNYSVLFGSSGDISEMLPLGERLLFVDRGLQYVGVTTTDGKSYRIIR